MKSALPRLGLVALLALAPLAACGEKGDRSTAETPTADAVPSQDELDAQAASEISDDNADETFSDLKNEIEGDK